VPNNKIKRAPCRECHGETKHLVLCKREVDGEDKENGWQWRDTYEFLECGGCGKVSLCHTFDFSEEPEPTVRHYPPPVSRRKPSWHRDLPYDLMSLLSEVYSALDADSRRLALMGARTVADMVLEEAVGDIGSFAEKLRELEKQGFVGKRNREILRVALDAGSAAAHRGFQPTTEDLTTVMDIIENVVQAVFVLESAAKRLREATPPRQSVPKPARPRA
jgi:hypothetical protein